MSLAGNPPSYIALGTPARAKGGRMSPGFERSDGGSSTKGLEPFAFCRVTGGFGSIYCGTIRRHREKHFSNVSKARI
jgi:hypothetical protein